MGTPPRSRATSRTSRSWPSSLRVSSRLMIAASAGAGVAWPLLSQAVEKASRQARDTERMPRACHPGAGLGELIDGRRRRPGGADAAEVVEIVAERRRALLGDVQDGRARQPQAGAGEDLRAGAHAGQDALL